LSVTLGGAPEDLEVLKRNRDLGVARMTVRLPPAKEDEILPILFSLGRPLLSFPHPQICRIRLSDLEGFREDRVG
jgi:hypothetical protein